jgi:hypothetical protein
MRGGGLLRAARGFGARLGAGAGLARLACGAFGGRVRRLRGAQRRFGLGQRILPAAARLGGGNRLGQFLALFAISSGGGAMASARSSSAAARRSASSALRFSAVSSRSRQPDSSLVTSCRRFSARLAFAPRSSCCGPAGDHGQTRGLDRGFQGASTVRGPAPDRAGRPWFPASRPAVRPPRLGSVEAVTGQTRGLQLAAAMERSASARRQGAVASVTRASAARRASRAIWSARARSASRACRASCACAGAIGAGRASSRSRFNCDKAVQLPQAQGGGRRRILGPGAEPVPAPQIALEADQPLPGAQRRLAGAGLIGAVHQPICARRRASTSGTATCGASGAARRARGRRVIGAARPSPSASAPPFRGAQVIGQRRTQGRLVARFHLTRGPAAGCPPAIRVPPVLPAPPPRRAGIRLAFGGGPGGAGLGLARLGGGAGGFGLGQRGSASSASAVARFLAASAAA